MKYNLRKKISLITAFAIFSLSALTGCGGSQKTNPKPVSAQNKSETLKVSSQTSENKKLKVMASFYPMYDFAAKIGGEKADVFCMVPDGVEPHDWEPSPADIASLENANLFVYSGAGMEHWVPTVLSALKNKNLVSAEASHGLVLRKGHKHHHDENDKEKKHAHDLNDSHDEHEFDPHVWISPLNAKKEMENIKEAFIKADPENKTYYESNYEKYAKEFDKLNEEFKKTLASVPNKNIVVSHEAFGYLCDAYGIKQIGIEGLSPDSEPDPSRMTEIIKFVKKNNVKVIFFEELVSPKVAKTIAEATGAKAEVLNPLEGLSDNEKKNGEDYFSVMRKNLSALKNALQ